MNSKQIKIYPFRAEHGESILIKYSGKTSSANILIDGGTKNTFTQNNYSEFNRLKSLIQNNTIDLLIISHYDDDHIEGLIELFKNHKFDVEVKELWFNSSKVIMDNLGVTNSARIMKRVEELDPIADKRLSASKSITLHEFFENNSITPKFVKVGDKIEFGDLEISLLSPTIKVLEKLLKQIDKSDRQLSNEESDWSDHLSDLISTDVFKKDSSKSNASSIAIKLTCMNDNYLFLGDSVPNIIIDSLNDLGYASSNKLSCKLITLPHHGSERNLNSALLDLISCSNYLITSDSSKHKHPNKRTLARIITSNTDNETTALHFNYPIHKKIFNDIEIKDYYININDVEGKVDIL